MPKSKEFKKTKCCICHKTLKKPDRMVHQVWDKDKSIYKNNGNYDFCRKHFNILMNWIERS